MNKIAPGTIFRLLSVSMLLIASSFVYVNSESINDAISSSVETRDGNESSLVGLADEEFWPVLRVSFPAKPFPNSLLGSLFEGNYSAEQYISEMSGGDSKLKTTIVGETWASPYLESHWGTDSVSERDTGSDSGGVRELAREAIISTFQNQDISQWDLDGDFIIDRLLILHSGQAQEEGGPSTSIWSHFSAFYEPVVVGEYTFEHYTMASVHGGLGVLVHEMLHQMGAVDLYDVHSDAPTRNWHGLGDWDIMASGNWIEDGSRPTLPSSSTLDLIGAIDPIQPSLTSDGNFSLKPLSDGGNPLKIEIAPQEYVWITLRSNTGFDMGLPGHGILVEQQDLNFGDVSSNLVNTDPIKPWVKIVEADGDDALLRARDYGSAGDVFDVGDRFGHTGQKIWDNHGRLVQWTATVIDISDSFATIEFDFIGDANSTVTVPRNPIVVLSDEPIVVDIYSIDECKVVVDISSTGDVVIPPHDGNSTRINLIEITNSSSNKGTIEGNIGSGKTSLSKQISADFNTKLMLERFIDNPFLAKFYKNPRDFAFKLEMSFLADRYQQTNKDLSQLNFFNNNIISDYDVHKSLIFSKINLLTFGSLVMGAEYSFGIIIKALEMKSAYHPYIQRYSSSVQNLLHKLILD